MLNDISDQAATPEEIEEFFKVLGGGTRKTLPEAAQGGDDEKFEKEIDAQVALYKVSDASGSLKIEKIGEKPLSQTALNTNVGQINVEQEHLLRLVLQAHFFFLF